MRKIKIFTDGGSRGNPGPSASAFVVFDGTIIVIERSEYLGLATNNLAEYNGVLMALKWLKENFNSNAVEQVDFVLDSELVVKQLNGIYKVKNPAIKKIYLSVNNYINDIPCKFSFTSVQRSENRHADFLVNKELDLHD